MAGTITHPGLRAPAAAPAPAWRPLSFGDYTAGQTVPTPASSAAPEATPAQGTAWDIMQSTLAAWGLTSLGDIIRQQVYTYDTTDQDTLLFTIRNSDAYKQRFAGNAQLIADGKAPLSEVNYLSAESSMKEVMQAYNLPAGFYDSNADFAGLIGKGVSSDEVATRVQVAANQYMNADANTKQAWANYGYAQGDAIAAILDPTVGTQTIVNRGNAASIGGAASNQGFSVDKNRAEQFVNAQVTVDQAKQAYAKLAQGLVNDQDIASRFGTSVTQGNEEDAMLLDSGTDQSKLDTLRGEEKSLFEQTAGGSANALGTNLNF